MTTTMTILLKIAFLLGCHYFFARFVVNLPLPVTFDSRSFCLMSHFLTTAHLTSILHTVYSRPSNIFNTWATIKCIVD